MIKILHHKDTDSQEIEHKPGIKYIHIQTSVRLKQDYQVIITNKSNYFVNRDDTPYYYAVEDDVGMIR